jgi:hypothetical protein
VRRTRAQRDRAPEHRRGPRGFLRA